MSKPIKRPTIEKMKKFEEYIECSCGICQRTSMLNDISVALRQAAIDINPSPANLSRIVELAELVEAAERLVNFHVQGHLANEFGLSIEEARHIVDYKNSLPNDGDDDDIPF